jgi:hypothetical protein
LWPVAAPRCIRLVAVLSGETGAVGFHRLHSSQMESGSLKLRAVARRVRGTWHGRMRHLYATVI